MLTRVNNNFMLRTIKFFIVLMDQIIKKKEVLKMKTSVKIYDRFDNDVPYNSPIYIIDTRIGYVVITNLYGYTFREKFKTKDEALDYYNRKKVLKWTFLFLSF